MHTAALVAHAAAGVVCFAAGCVLLFRLDKPTGQRGWLAVYGASLAGMILFMWAAMAAHWDALSRSRQITYLGLTALALYMAARAWSALLAWRHAPPGWRSRFADGVGFTLISLFDAFAIVAAIDLGLSGWVVAAIAAAGVVVGTRAMQRVKKRVAA